MHTETESWQIQHIHNTFGGRLTSAGKYKAHNVSSHEHEQENIYDNGCHLVFTNTCRNMLIN